MEEVRYTKERNTELEEKIEIENAQTKR